jgi:RimJ/RimL family protein N-acetyltransferase
MIDKFSLETERLRVRSFEHVDLATFVAYRNDEAVARYQGWNTPYTYEQAQSFLEEMEQVSFGTPEVWFQLAIERKSDGAMVGDCAHKLSKDARQAEIGCTLAQTYWGNGYAVEAVSRLLSYLFDECRLHRVYANTDVENLAAARTLEQIGLRREAHFIENLWFKGRWSSEYWYAMLASDWQQAHQDMD